MENIFFIILIQRVWSLKLVMVDALFPNFNLKLIFLLWLSFHLLCQVDLTWE